jgi:two-component system phosphate regulon response regulator PhoB
MPAKVFILDDEEDICAGLAHSIARAGFRVATASDGRTGLEKIRAMVPDLLLLDVMLPGIDGTEICRIIRADAVLRDVSIMMLSARGEESDILVGLALGADDYVTKPFQTREVIARIHSVLRRGRRREEDPASEVIRHGRLEIDTPRHEVRIDQQPVALTATEFRLLRVLASHPRRVFTRDQLLNQVIGDNAVVIDRNIDVHVRSIRRKLGPARDRIETIRSVGYRFAPE